MKALGGCSVEAIVYCNDDTGNQLHRKSDQQVLSFQAVCSLLHLNEAALRKGLCSRLIVAGGESMVKQENAIKAKQCLDALAKALYSRLFDNVVKFVNSALRIKGANTGTTMQVCLM